MSKKKALNEWSIFFDQKGLSEDLKTKYLRYIKILIDKDIPVIFEFTHLSKLLARSPGYLASVVNSSENHYRVFKLKKRSGAYREITVPYPALLGIQYWIYKNILLKVSVNPACHGFTKKKSIITNSKVHLGQEQVLKLDLKDFFPSIELSRIVSFFKTLGYPTNISFYLAAICCINRRLPQGAPTSPYLSNIICRDLDKRLYLLSKKFNLKYSRYADDLTFSGKEIPAKMIDYISSIIESEGFVLNGDKTRLYRNSSKIIVTGICVSGESLKLPKSYKRNLLQEMYYIRKFGIHSHVSNLKIKHTNYLDVLIGKFNFWLSVEKDCDNARSEIEYLYMLKNTKIIN